MITERLRKVTGGAPVFPLLILFGLNAVDELDRSAFGVLTPTIRDDFGLDNQGILNVITVVGIIALGSQLLIGYFADRFSRVRIALGGAAVWGAFTMLTGLAPSVGVLILFRVGTGFGRAVNDPTHNSLLADYYPPESRVGVYGVHRAANAVGLLAGPALGGILAQVSGSWRVPFLVFWIPTILLVILGAIRLRDPSRGEQERRAMGASDELIAQEEAPPAFSEAWRACMQVKTLRRIFFALPFVAGALIGVGSLYAIAYKDIHGLTDGERGVLGSLAEIGALAGLGVGVPIASKLARRDPGLVLKFLAVVGVIVSLCILGFAFAPNVGVAMACNFISTASFAVLLPGIYSSLALVIPPKARALGFSIGAIFTLPGVFVLVIIGAVSEDIGVRKSIALLTPVFLLGAAILASAGRFVREDAQRVQAAALAQAEVMQAQERGEVKLLLAKGVDVGYGSVQVLFDVDFEVQKGDIIALLGTNGAGKSTLLRAISGLNPPSSGSILFEGVDISNASPQEIAARGIVQVPGGKGVFPGLTVEENFKIAGWLYRKQPEHLEKATAQVLEYFPVLKDRWDQPAGNLSGGEQQMLTLGQAFIAQPKLLMIDELSLGLAPVIVEQLLVIVRAIQATGTTIILVEQSINVALTIAETAFFMEKGEIRFRGPTAELLERPDVLRSVFLQGAATFEEGDGATDEVDAEEAQARKLAARAARRTEAADLPPVMEARNLVKAYGGIRATNDVSFTLGKGEILGFIGPNGAGKTTLFDLLSGFVAPDHGLVYLGGTDVTGMSADARHRLGMGRSFQDARLFPGLTVSETIAVAFERQIEIHDPVAAMLHLPAVADAEKEIREKVDALIEQLGIGAFADKFISELSTGSRRVVDLACIVAHEPSVILFDEPSSGIAQKETEAMGPLLTGLRDTTGAALIVIEHDMPLITSISDRIIALDLGAVVTSGDPEEVLTDPAVVASYLGSDEATISRSGTMPSKAVPAGTIADGNGTHVPDDDTAPPRRREPIRARARSNA